MFFAECEGSAMRNGINDCITKPYLCENEDYRKVLEAICRRTCGFCGSGKEKTAELGKFFGRVSYGRGEVLSCSSLGVVNVLFVKKL